MNSYVLKWKRINDAIIQHKAQHFMKTETFLFQVVEVKGEGVLENIMEAVICD
jgi:hypothetical protein